MATFVVRRGDPVDGAIVATGDAEIGQAHIRAVDEAGTFLTATDWAGLVALHTPPRFYVTWPDGEPE
jgi:hypothetical protein